MNVDINNRNATISENMRVALHRAVMAELGPYLAHVESIALRLGESHHGSKRGHAHCRASARLRGGKTVWVDRSHARLDSAALTAIEQLRRVVGLSLAREQLEGPVFAHPDRAAGEGWVILEPLASVR